MSGGLTKKQLQGIKKGLSYNYILAKERKRKKRMEKATRQKTERHKSRQQEIEEIVQDELELEEGEDS